MSFSLFFFFNATATTEIYTLSLHDALPIFDPSREGGDKRQARRAYQEIQRRRELQPAQESQAVDARDQDLRSEEHTSELQSRENLVCRLLLEKKKKNRINNATLNALY